MINLYHTRAKFKFWSLLSGAVIALLSLVYTNQLVHELESRERQIINQYAKAQQELAEADGFENINLALEIIQSNKTIPVLLLTGQGRYVAHLNFKLPSEKGTAAFDKAVLAEKERMEATYDPIAIPSVGQKIYYRDSELISQLKYYPFAQLFIIAVFGLLTYSAFSNSRRAEQNRVWVGLAKETAHQLGTPLSALMAWVELLKTNEKYDGEEALVEMEKDVDRLKMVAARFSSIGSEPQLSQENIIEVVSETVNYLKRRISPKIRLNLFSEETEIPAWVNIPLFGWVIENLVKNAIDAMDGSGSIDLAIRQEIEGRILIEVTDTGKGMTRNQATRVFDPGYTTKARGWGLGLTLTKRIIEQYHKGSITVRWSAVGKGTCFKITLPGYSA